jgi:hypothetical protein
MHRAHNLIPKRSILGRYQTAQSRQTQGPVSSKENVRKPQLAGERTPDRRGRTKTVLFPWELDERGGNPVLSQSFKYRTRLRRRHDTVL